MTLHQLLQKVSEGKPVNFKRLKQMLPKNFDSASWQKAIEYLVNRGFAFATSADTYMLSSAGAAFCQAVIDAYDEVR